MIIEGIDSVDLDKIYPGDTVQLKLAEKNMVSSLINTAQQIGCTLIFLNYGKFYFKEFISKRRSETIDTILSDL
tara:strand:- start:1531 stop:1752 length:222 start_codon:yes stop_codon:yes gene_type:complete